MVQEKALHWFKRTGPLLLIILFLSSCYGHREGLRPKAEKSEEPAGLPVERPVLADSPEVIFQEAIEEKKRDNFEEAINKLVFLRKTYPETPWARRASFLLGILALEGGAPEGGDSAAFFNEASIEEIGDWVQFYLAEAYSIKGERLKALWAYETLLDRYPGSTVAPEVLYEKAALLQEVGDAVAAKVTIDSFLHLYPKNPLYPAALLRGAVLSTELGDTSGAERLLRKLLTEHPTHAAKEAEALLAGLKFRGLEVPDLTPEERYARGKIFFGYARFSEAAAEFSHALKEGEGRYYERSVEHLAQSLMKLRRYAAAKEVLVSHLSRPKVERRLALYLLLEAAFHLGEEKFLLKTERELSEDFPSSDERAKALLLAGKFFEGKGDEESARRYRVVVNEFRGSSPASEALWRLGWMDYRKERYGEAFEIFRTLASASKDAGRPIYWMARSMEKLGRFPEALSIYGEVCHEYEASYYCQMALERKERLPGSAVLHTVEEAPLNHPAQDNAPLDHSREIKTDIHYVKALELKTLGLYEPASRELEAASGRYRDRGSIIEIAKVFYDMGDYHRALKTYLKVREKGGEADPVLKMFAFPPGVVDFIKDASIPGSADPLLVAAVMREESYFNPRARSRAGALGLMQIMPSTGELVLREIEETASGEADLFNPALNTRLGALYLGRLARKFSGNPVLTIAGYNAGPAAASRWAERGFGEVDEFIEGIPYSETREYAKKVIRSYTEYLRLWGLNPWERFTRPIVAEEAPSGF